MQSDKPEIAEVQPSLNTRIEQLNEKVDALIGKKEKSKSKEYKMPFKVKSKLKGVIKKNQVLVCYLRDNRNAGFLFCNQSDQMVHVDGSWRDMSEGTVFLLNGKTPMIVMPEWSMRPIGTEAYHEAIKNKENVDAETLIIKAMEKAEPTGKDLFGNLNWKMVLLIIGLLGVGAWVLFGGTMPNGTG